MRVTVYKYDKMLGIETRVTIRTDWVESQQAGWRRIMAFLKDTGWWMIC